MTDPIVQLETPQLTVEPGGQARSLVTVRNPGTIVEGFRLHVVGEGASDWAEVTPPEVQVYPDQEATAVVVFSPPAGSATRSGSFPFGVRAESVVDAGTSAVAEGDLEIGRVFGLQAKLTPVTSSGRWRGKHFITLTNWGNAPVRLKLTAGDPDENLAFLVGPEILDLPLGVTGHAQLRVKTKSPFLRGTPTRLPFQLVAQPDPPETPTGPLSPLPDPRRATMDGAFNAKPILSKLTVTAALVGVLAIGGGVAYALTRDSAEASAELASGPPRTPELSAVAKDATSIQLLWQGQAGMESYRIHQLTAEGNTTGVQTVDGALDSFVMAELEPETDYCFQLEAVRGGQSSPLSGQQCARTGLTPPPTDASGTAGSSESAASSAVSTPPALSSAVVSAPTPQTAVTPPTGASAGAPGAPGAPGGSGASSVPATSGAGAPGTGNSGAPPTTGSSPGAPGTFTPNQFIGVVFAVPAADAQAQQRAEDRRQQLVQAGIAASVLRTSEFPNLRFGQSTQPPTDSYLVYVGPFENSPALTQFCQAQATLLAPCLPVRPNP